jgi:hypothetical protein
MMAFYALTLFKKEVLAWIAMLTLKNAPPPTKRLCAIILLGYSIGITDICVGQTSAYLLRINPAISFYLTTMKKAYLFLLLFTCSQMLSAQLHTLAKRWDYTFGGKNDDIVYSVIQTRSGNILLGGYTNSSRSGDISQINIDSGGVTADVWVVKMNKDGVKLWDKRYGSVGEDLLWAMTETPDGGYLLGCNSSYQGISGDKTQANRGDVDYWIIKIDSNGVKQWDKWFGGYGYDFLESIANTTDGGYILGGQASGGGGDISPSTCGSSFHYWIVKIDSQGVKQWDKKICSSNGDALTSVIQTMDGGYMAGGYSLGGISNDKSQANQGMYDYWVVKTDSIGNKQWDRTFGGYYDDLFCSSLQLEDSGYLFSGTTASQNTGDQNSTKRGYWVIRTDKNGTILWKNVYEGGLLVSASITKDKGFLYGGISGYNKFTDKSEFGLGTTQAWIVKTDSLGLKMWDKTILTYDSNIRYDPDGYVGGFTAETNDNCYLVTLPSDAKPGGYKTDTCRGYFDYFVIKMCDTTVSGIEETKEDGISISAYPNPFQSEVSIHLASDDIHAATFTLTNAIGQVVYHSKEDNLSSSYTKMLDLKALPSGAYFLSVEVNGRIITKKLVKQ